MTPARLAAVLVLATVLGLAVVHQNAHIRQAGYELSALNGRIAEQRAELAIHKAHLSKLKSPRRILALVDWLGLDLRERPVAPAAPQVAAAEDASRTTERSIAALSTY
jgi:cell division protein FtsL